MDRIRGCGHVGRDHTRSQTGSFLTCGLAKIHLRISMTTLIACVELLQVGKSFQRTAASTENRPVRSRT